MKLREKYRTLVEDDECILDNETEGENGDLDITCPPPLVPRPSLISITEDHAVNILSQLSREKGRSGGRVPSSPCD
jgi:hypothetical protein